MRDLTQDPSALRRPAAPHYLHQSELATRWRMSPRTLEGWRYRKKGPPYATIGGHVRYRLEDVEAYEAANLHGQDWSR
jgi:hypothetical protein